MLRTVGNTTVIGLNRIFHAVSTARGGSLFDSTKLQHSSKPRPSCTVYQQRRITSDTIYYTRLENFSQSTPCLKISGPLLQTRLLWFVVHKFQWNILHCTVLTLLRSHPLWCTYFTVCAQFNIIMTSKFTYVKLTFNTLLLTKGIKQQHTCLKLRTCIEAKDGHFKLKL